MFEFMNKPLGFCMKCGKFGFIFAKNYRFCDKCRIELETFDDNLKSIPFPVYPSSPLNHPPSSHYNYNQETKSDDSDLDLIPIILSAAYSSTMSENNSSDTSVHLEQNNVSEIFDDGDSGGGGASGSWESSDDSSSSDCSSSDSD